MLSGVCVYVACRGVKWITERERDADEVRRAGSRLLMERGIERILRKRDDTTLHALNDKVTESWLVICDLRIWMSDGND